MRIKFVNGKQKSLIKEYKSKNNGNWKKISEKLDTNINTIYSYYNEKSLLPQKLYEKICQDKYYKKYDEYIIETQEDNWGKIIGSNKSDKGIKKILLPQKSVELAEFIGIIYGKSIISSYSGTNYLRIKGDYLKDKFYFKYFIKPLSEQLFGINAKIKINKEKKEITLTIYSKELIKYLKLEKINRKEIPNWIIIDDDYTKAFLRGIVDNSKSLENIKIKNFETKIDYIKLTSKKLIILDVRKYLNEIGFSNSKHLIKLQKAS